MSKKRIYQIHKWAGVTIGLVLLILAISGSVITFRAELMPKVYPGLFQVRPQSKKIPIEHMLVTAKNHLGKDRRITNLYGTENSAEAYMVLYKDPKIFLPGLLTINPYTGEVLGEMSLVKNVFAVMLFLHANLFLGKFGSYFVGTMGLVLIFFIISGIYIWLPAQSLTEKVKRALKFSRPTFLQKLHHFLGLAFALPLLISATTGFLTVFDLSYFSAQLVRPQPPRVAELERKGECDFQRDLEALRLVTDEMAEKLISVHLCSPKNAYLKVSYGLKNAHFLEGYGRIIIDPVKKEIIQSFHSGTDPSNWNLKRLVIFPIHTGEYLGYFGRFIVLFEGIILAALFFTGVTLFIKRKGRKSA